MAKQANLLFNPKTIKKLCDSVEITPEQKEAACEWIDLLDQNQLKDEKKNYLKFASIILEKILGYPIKEIDFESDNVEFQFRNSTGKKIVCFEVKGTEIADLFALQHRIKKEHETPIKQTWNYMGINNLEYGVCTNYKTFVLIDKNWSLTKYHVFDFTGIKDNEDKLKEFISIFSRKSIIDNKFLQELYQKSVLEERELTEDFYKLFHETRLMLIEEFQHNGNISREEAIHYAQLYLNRLIFSFFAEDNDLIPNRIFATKIQQVISSPLISEHTKLVSETISSFFQSLNKGSNMQGIFGFNGGLFQEVIPSNIFLNDLRDPSFFTRIKKYSKLKKSVTVDEISHKIIKKYHGKLNPIISNFLIMDSFDFNTELNVNILGHIFEQSLTDLEEFKNVKVSKRKKEGIFYTPEYVTDYICRNTIIPYLSKTGITNTDELVAEYASNIETLEKKIKEIKILDPACGSGAFLIKAADVLLEIGKKIQDFKNVGRVDQLTLAKWNEENEITRIIESNIYGVDINEESIEITKLGLFLKLASTHKKLINLSENIMVGNSLVHDKTVDSKAFDWNARFKDVIDSGGFDIIIGNPPYFNVETLGVKSAYVEYLKKEYSDTWMDKSDILFYFITKAIQLSKKNVGFIVSNAFLFSDKAKKLRNHILSNAPLSRIVNFEQYMVFEDAEITSAIIELDKSKKDNNCKAVVLKEKNYQEYEVASIIRNDKNYFDVLLKKDSIFALVNEEIENLNSKIDNAGVPLGELFKVGSGMQTGINEVFLFDKYPSQFPSELIKKRISGEIIEKYLIKKEIEYCLYVEDFEKIDDLPKEVRSYLLENKNKLESRADKKRRKTAKWWNYTFSMHKEYYHLNKIWCSYRCKENTFAYDDTKEYVGMTNTTVIFDTNEQISLKYLLTLLNSSTLNFRYRSIGKQTGGGIFEYFENGVSKLPVIILSKDKQQPFIKMAELMLELKKEFEDKKSKFLARVKQNFNVQRISLILEKFYELDFQGLCKELKEQKIEIRLEQQDQWEEYFEERRMELIGIKEKIKEIENEINEMVFQIYGITTEERRIIEDTVWNDLKVTSHNTLDKDA